MKLFFAVFLIRSQRWSVDYHTNVISRQIIVYFWSEIWDSTLEKLTHTQRERDMATQNASGEANLLLQQKREAFKESQQKALNLIERTDLKLLSFQTPKYHDRFRLNYLFVESLLLFAGTKRASSCKKTFQKCYNFFRWICNSEFGQRTSEANFPSSELLPRGIVYSEGVCQISVESSLFSEFFASNLENQNHHQSLHLVCF